MQRRTFLATASAAGAVALAGCSRAKPTVAETNAESQLFGQTRIDVVVVNDGPAGEVEVVVTIYSTDGTVQSKHRKTVEMAKGERREVTFRIDIESEADHFTAAAKPVRPF